MQSLTLHTRVGKDGILKLETPIGLTDTELDMESILPGDVVLCSIVKNDSAAEQYGRLRASLEKQGALIGPYDLLIVSIALANNVTLVTHSTDEFKRVPGLKMEDWQA